MGNASFNQDWYGMQAKVLAQSDDRVVVDYGCKGRGIVKNYNLFEGIQLCFLDFESDESMETQKFNPDIIQITHCQTGRYECEFANHTVSYLPEGYFSVAATEHLPVSFSFPLGKYYGVSLVIDRQALSDGTRRMMQTIPIDLDKIGTTLRLETRWYVSDTPAQLKHLFSELYSAAETEPIGYFKIKAIELLYHMDQLTQINGCDLKYFDKKQIQSTKAIREYLVSHLDEKVSLEQMAKEAHLNLSVFHLVFSHIYGDTPYAYLKKYKMNLAAQWLSEDKMKIGDIALELGYQVMLDRYQQTIRELHIEKLKDRNLFDLSGGQKQTIAFASVYALNPDIFVLDEPSSNLDPEAIQELRRLLLLIKAQGKTIVVSEHRLYFLNGIADRIVLMEHGKLKQSWSASDFALFNAEQIKALGLRSYTPTRLELPDTMPSRNEPPAVEVKDLAIGYEKGEPVAQHLNFRVYPGEIVGVVGKNGCGKSTLARTLCGLQKELCGEVLYKNSMVPSKRRIRKAYLVMQDPDYQLFTDSVYQELLLALSDQKDKDEKRIDDILDELNLTTYKERHPMSLSGGQKQRTAIGVAALRDAEVLIFDEPTSGLDYKNMESVAEILSALSKRGKAILVISHDNELLIKICSRVIRVDERTSS